MKKKTLQNFRLPLFAKRGCQPCAFSGGVKMAVFEAISSA